MLVVEENYVAGVPQTIVAGWSPKGAGWHWDAGLGGRAGWEATIRHLVNTRYTVNASYHGGFWCEHDVAHKACRTILQWIVRTTVAAHSFNPAHCFVPKTGSAREKERFAEVHRILERDTDPNADAIALAYSGMPAGLAKDLECPVFRADLRNLAQQLVDHPTIVDRPHFGHGWIQPTTRYETDAVSGGADLLINPVLYATADPVEEDDMTWLNQVTWYKTPALVTFRPGAAYRLTPTLDDTGAYFADAELQRVVIGEVQGFDFGAGPKWLVIAGDGGVAKAVHSQDETARVPLVVGNTMTEAEVAKLELEARGKGFIEGRDAAAAAAQAVTP